MCNTSPLHEVETFIAQACTYGDAGDFETAGSLLQQAAALAREFDLPTAAGRAEFYLGEVYGRLDGGTAGLDLDRSVDREHLHTERALRAFFTAGDQAGCLQALSKLALKADTEGKPKLARFYLSHIQRLDTPTAEWWVWYIEAHLLLSEGFIDKAKLLFEQCMTQIHMLPAGVRETHLWNCRRQLAWVAPSSRERVGLLSQNLVEASARGSDTEIVRSALGLAMASAAMSTDMVDFYLQMAAKAVERSRMKIIAPEKQRTITEAGSPIYTALLQRALARREQSTIFNTVEMSRSRAILSQFVTASLWHAYPPTPYQLDQAADLRRQEARCFREIRTYGASWQDADKQLIQRWKFRLKVRRNFLYQLEESMLSRACEVEALLRPVTCEELQAQLPEHTAVVLYIVGDLPESTPYALVVTAAEIETIQLPATVHSVHTAIAEYRRNLATIARSPRGGTPWRSDPVPDQFLYSALIAPLQACLRGSKQIYLIPDDILWQFPIHTCGGEQALCIEHLVGYVFSGSVLSRLLERKHADVPPRGFLGIAVSDSILPGAEEEVAFAARAFADSTTLIGSAVTLNAILASIGQAAIIHIACHGSHFQDFPEFSYLQLNAEQHGEERLEVCTVAQTPITADLVVLNACQSGRGAAHFGNDFIGFPSAFLAAGAATTIGTLWNIDNEAAIAFMTHFYQALAGSSKACAFQAAQRIVAETPAYRHPFFWGAFQWFGLLE